MSVIIAVDSCTPAFVAAVKQSGLFAETCRHPEPTFGRRRGKEKEVIRLIRSQGTIGMILKLIFQGLKIKRTYSCFYRSYTRLETRSVHRVNLTEFQLFNASQDSWFMHSFPFVYAKSHDFFAFYNAVVFT